MENFLQNENRMFFDNVWAACRGGVFFVSILRREGKILEEEFASSGVEVDVVPSSFAPKVGGFGRENGHVC